MLSDKVKQDCLKARPYYYDFLVDGNDSYVPEGILRHIAVCRYCKSEIHRLKGMLAKKKPNPGGVEGQKLSCISDILNFHFFYLDSFVNCKDVKPFLPVMLIGWSGVKIPTPITAHIDHCSCCAEDIKTLKKLDLQESELIRFAHFLAKRPRRPSTRIPQIEDSQKADSGKAYEHLFKSEIFEYCFPYKAELNEREYADFRKSVDSHLRECPKCLEKAEYIQKALNSIVERPDSGVATHYSIKENSQEQCNQAFANNDLHADWPINVKVFGKTGRKAVSAFSGLKSRMKSLNFRKYARVVLPAAAAILIAVTLLVGIRPARAVDFQQVYQAVRGLENAKISLFIPGQKGPWQVKWLSKPLDIKLFRMDGEFTLWDFSANLVKKASSLSAGTVSKRAITEARSAEGRNMMDESFGLTPFAQRDNVSENVVWQPVSEDEPETAGADTEVYDLYRTSQGPNLFLEKARYFIDPATNLPKRVEHYSRDSSEKDFTLGKFYVITHPETEQIEKLIQDVFK